MITKIEVVGNDVTFYFNNTEIPWSVNEFRLNSLTRRYLRRIVKRIVKANSMLSKEEY